MIFLLVIPFANDFLKGELDLLNSVFVVLFFIVFIAFIFKGYHGFHIVGIDDDTFHKCLSSSLDNLKIEREEKLSKIVIKDSDFVILC